LGSFLSAPDQRTLAYLDPGSGSFILQLLLAALVGSLFILKTYWKRIIAFFRKQRSDDDQGDEE
jgi:hypothetical protein